MSDDVINVTIYSDTESNPHPEQDNLDVSTYTVFLEKAEKAIAEWRSENPDPHLKIPAELLYMLAQINQRATLIVRQKTNDLRRNYGRAGFNYTPESARQYAAALLAAADAAERGVR